MNLAQENKNYNIFKSIELPTIDKYNIYNIPHIIKPFDIKIEILIKSPVMFKNLLDYYQELDNIFNN